MDEQYFSELEEVDSRAVEDESQTIDMVEAMKCDIFDSEFRREIFDFLRVLKRDHPGKEFHEIADLIVVWQETHKTYDLPEVMTYAADSWDRIKYAKDRLLECVAKADDVVLPPAMTRLLNQSGRKIAAVCYLLSETNSEGRFFFPSVHAPSIAGVSSVTSWRILQLLWKMKFFERISIGTRAGRKASEFRWIAGKCIPRHSLLRSN